MSAKDQKGMGSFETGPIETGPLASLAVMIKTFTEARGEPPALINISYESFQRLSGFLNPDPDGTEKVFGVPLAVGNVFGYNPKWSRMERAFSLEEVILTMKQEGRSINSTPFSQAFFANNPDILAPVLSALEALRLFPAEMVSIQKIPGNQAEKSPLRFQLVVDGKAAKYWGLPKAGQDQAKSGVLPVEKLIEALTKPGGVVLPAPEMKRKRKPKPAEPEDLETQIAGAKGRKVDWK